MKTIEVDDEVWEALARRARGFGATPNSVLRGLLGLAAAGPANTERIISGRALSAGRQGLSRYVEAFARMYHDHADRFPDLERLLNRSRLYLSQDAQKMMSSGIGVHVKQIQDTPYWLMTTIDNNQKRRVVSEALEFLGYPAETIGEILAGLPESKPRVKLPTT